MIDSRLDIQLQEKLFRSMWIGLDRGHHAVGADYASTSILGAASFTDLGGLGSGLLFPLCSRNCSKAGLSCSLQT